jgi:YidC/Oxa1 family membrane protein insertase
LSDKPDKEIRVSTNLYTAVFSSNLARLSSFKLLKYKDNISSPDVVKLFKKIFSSRSDENLSDKSAKSNNKEMINLNQKDDLPLRSSFINSNGKAFNYKPFESDKDNLILDRSIMENSLIFKQSDQEGFEIQKKFLFRENDYIIDFTITFSNSSNSTREGNAFVEWTAPIPSTKSSGFFGTSDTSDISRFTYFINGKVEKIELKDAKDKRTLEGEFLWASIEEKYFMSAIMPRSQKPSQVRIGKAQDSDIISYQLLYPHIALNPGDQISYSFSLYVGPLDINILKQQGANLEKAIDFGYFDIIAKPLLLSLIFFSRYIGNYGVSIILITIIIKILFWPLTNKSMKSMKGMQNIQPEIAKLKEKYSNNKEEFAKQQMALYKKYKVNPLGGCLPMLLQIPVFIALYRVLGESIELRHANFISFWINDLSAKDPTYIAPILMGISMLLQQKMTPSSADPAQAKMMMFMPVIFTVMFLNFPSGLVIYWLTNNVLSILQQLYINKKSNVSGGT